MKTCSLPPLACSLQLVACSPWKPFVYIDVNVATPCKLFGDKESDVNENLWSLKVSDLEPWISGKCRALRKWHFQYLTFLRKCTFGANCDQGIQFDGCSASLKCKSESLTQKSQIWTIIWTNHWFFIGNFKISMTIYKNQLSSERTSKIWTRL